MDVLVGVFVEQFNMPGQRIVLNNRQARRSLPRVIFTGRIAQRYIEVVHLNELSGNSRTGWRCNGHRDRKRTAGKKKSLLQRGWIVFLAASVESDVLCADMLPSQCRIDRARPGLNA